MKECRECEYKKGTKNDEDADIKLLVEFKSHKDKYEVIRYDSDLGCINYLIGKDVMREFVKNIRKIYIK